MKAASVALDTFLLQVIAKGGNFFVADLYTFTLVSGTVVRWTSADESLTVGANTFTAAGPYLKRSKIRTSVGLSVDSLEINLLSAGVHHVAGIPVLIALERGMFDGATVRVERLFMPTFGDVSLGTIVQFSGTVSEVPEIGRTHARIMVRSKLELLNVMMPKKVIHPGCGHTLFDAGCTLNPASFRVFGTVGSGPNNHAINTSLSQPGAIGPPTGAPTLSYNSQSVQQPAEKIYWAVVTYTTANGETTASPQAYQSVPAGNVIACASPSAASGATGWNFYAGLSPSDMQRQNPAPLGIGTSWNQFTALAAHDGQLVQGSPPPVIATDGYFTLGTITFTSGVLNGLSYFIMQFNAGIITVLPVFLAIPAPGDTFFAEPGCSKELSVCRAKFSNEAHFNGKPWVPVPEAGA
jgi:hypothetical protein